MTNAVSPIKTRNKNALMAFLWVFIWGFQLIDVFILRKVPQTGVDFYIKALLVALGPFFIYAYGRRAMESNMLIAREISEHRSVEDRLDELERLKRRDMVTPEEYAAKRQEILKDL